ncbi:hypothetical protein ACIBG8_19600 [Nonomuraea sp. NPDC050556]|uniref:hypothetical protein n=1 Tax=Nonomuraea sp. NPDC050556 TaxID=3364369 RepID=UPI0037A8632F
MIDIDPEKLIIKALQYYLPEHSDRVMTLAPTDWSDREFLVVRATGGGASSQPHLYKVCYFEIEAFSSTRGDASRLARRAGEAMIAAARENFRDETAYLFRFREVNAPWLVHDGLSSKHGDEFMFQGTYNISMRSLR